MEPAVKPDTPRGIRARAAGFTLVELILAISIAAILMAIGVPMYRDVIANNRLTAQTNDLVSVLAMARSRAITLNQQVIFCRTTSAESVATPACVGSAGSWQYWLLRTAGGAIIRRGEVPNYGTAITVKSAGLTNDQVTFASDGLARTNNALVTGGPHIVVCSSHSTTNNKRQVTLGAGSRVSTVKASGSGCP